MRASVAAVVLLVVSASTAAADVRLMRKKDGSTVIYNVPSGSAKSNWNDYNWLAGKHDRRSKYDPIIERYAREFDVDPVLVRAVIQVESDFNKACVSRKGARGLMQLMPGTARRFNVAEIHDPDQNIRGGVHYLSILLRLFRDDLPRALAAYNAGENAVIRYGGIPPYQETETYVRRALTVYYGRPYGQAVVYAGKRTASSLRGGFQAKVVQPLAAAVIPGARYLGAR